MMFVSHKGRNLFTLQSATDNMRFDRGCVACYGNQHKGVAILDALDKSARDTIDAAYGAHTRAIYLLRRGPNHRRRRIPEAALPPERQAVRKALSNAKSYLGRVRRI